jgi:elongator complex protein 4
MSFRKRNVKVTAGTSQDHSTRDSQPPDSVSPGVRPSPLDGRVTISTGTPTLDSLLAGHSGLPLGTSLLIEENGTTDYSGALVRFFAAEGLVQGHSVHVVGFGDRWERELPGVVESTEKERNSQNADARMKIAWRYERLGQFEASHASTRGGNPTFVDSVPIDINRKALVLTHEQILSSSVWE